MAWTKVGMKYKNKYGHMASVLAVDNKFAWMVMDKGQDVVNEEIPFTVPKSLVGSFWWPVPSAKYVNVYKTWVSNFHSSRADADKAAGTMADERFACVKITEGQFDD